MLSPVEILKYLQFFYNVTADSLNSAEAKAAILAIQQSYNIPTTGEIDPITETAIRSPRCGVKEPLRHLTADARRIAKWTKQGLKYAVVKYLPRISRDDQDEVFKQSFAAWSKVANVKATQVPANTVSPDITISTGRGRRDNFDGPGNTLAWAELPFGDNSPLWCKFDEDEPYKIFAGTNRGPGVYLDHVATHEFGHLWGLDHNDGPNQLMNPFYNVDIMTPQSVEKQQMIDKYGKPIPTADPTNPTEEKKIVITIIGDKISIPNYRVMKL